MEENGRGLIQGTILASAWMDWEKSQKTSVRIAGLQSRFDPGTCQYETGVLTTKLQCSVMTNIHLSIAKEAKAVSTDVVSHCSFSLSMRLGMIMLWRREH
jgi:hypothetical protein